MQRVAKLGLSSPARQGRPPGNGKLAAYEAFLIGAVEDRPDITMPELSARLEAEHGVKAERRFWIDRRQPRMRLEPHRLVFVDETSITTKMVRLRGRAPRGERLLADAPFGHWGTQTFIAGLRCCELIAPWVIDKAINRAAFDVWVETQLAPTLSHGDVVIPATNFVRAGQPRRP
jgi:hypothetical protein